MRTPPLLAAVAVLSLLAGSACAHGAPDRRAAAPGASPPPERVLVTGSRLPQRVDPATGRATTASPVRVHTREELLGVGLGGNVAVALFRLEPALR